MEKQSNKLNLFSWEGKNENEVSISGTIEASSLKMARIYLRSNKIIITKIYPKKTAFFKQHRSIKPKDITLFTRQLATMLTSGIPLMQAFAIVANGHPNPEMAKVINEIKSNVEAGHPFSKSLQKKPLLFNSLYFGLVKMGEEVGALDTILERLATYKEKTDSLKAKIKKALVYPLTIITVAIVITSIILIYIIPQFESLFNGYGAQLPYLTREVVNLSKIMQNYWWLLLLCFGLLTYSVRILYRRHLLIKHFIEKNVLKVPLFGKLLKKAAIARFSRTLSTTISAGVPIAEGLNSVAAATGNIYFENAAFRIRQEITQGIALHKAIKNSRCFPEMLVQMVAVGEESGQLSHMLNKIADYYEEEVDNTVTAISTLIEPLLMIVLGAIIGTLIIAMYLPIFKMGSVI